MGKGMCFTVTGVPDLEVTFIISKSPLHALDHGHVDHLELDMKIPKQEWFAGYLSAQPEGGPFDVMALWDQKDQTCLVKIMTRMVQMHHKYNLMEFERSFSDKAPFVRPTLSNME